MAWRRQELDAAAFASPPESPLHEVHPSPLPASAALGRCRDMLTQSRQPGEHLPDLISTVHALSRNTQLVDIRPQLVDFEQTLKSTLCKPRLVSWQRLQQEDSAIKHQGLWNIEAWTGMRSPARVGAAIPASRMPCLALILNPGGCTARTYRKRQLGPEKSIKAGCHSFVRVFEEDFLRVSDRTFVPGMAGGHTVLADEKPVLFAGEIEIDEDGQLTRWNNVSGTYQFPKQLARQAQLPLEDFWAVAAPPADIDKHAHLTDSWQSISNGIWLRKLPSESAEDDPTENDISRQFWDDCERSLYAIIAMYEGNVR